MRVLKFGGTSLSNADQFFNVANIIVENVQSEQIAVVLSAPAMVTNNLIESIDYALSGNDILKIVYNIEIIFNTLLKDIAHLQSQFNHVMVRIVLDKEFDHLKQLLYGISLLQYCPDRINAKIICLGEKLSIILMEELLRSKNFKIVVINPVDNLIAQGGYLSSMVNIEKSFHRIQSILVNQYDIFLMAGFIAGNQNGELVTLGRNGSDYSAAILAVCLSASRCEIWTDVDGIYTCDPHQVPEAKLLRSLSYQEAMELSYFGAKVLHPRTILPIAQFHIPCLIKNVFKPNALGTLIGAKGIDEKSVVKGITYLNDIVMLNISGPGMKGMVGTAARIFSAMSKATCSIILITQSSSEYSISFCIPNQELEKVCIILNEEFNLELKNGLLEPIDIMHDLSVISVVGDGMRTQIGLSCKFFQSLFMANINIIAVAQGSSERSISVVVKADVSKIGVRAAHRSFFSSDKLAEIFVIGVGGVGSAFIEQINHQCAWLKKNKNLDIKICGIINSQVMLIDPNGLDLSCWHILLKKTREFCNLKKLMKIIKSHHLLNPIIIDCTNSLEVSNFYVNFLLNGCHIITPNKKANTGSMQDYYMLRDIMSKSNKKFLYDTNVGAGLPVIENLQNLLNSGDNFISFTGILSGSLSFIFGKLDEGFLLSEATLLAKNKGYTEPDPRDDLSGIDVARKLLILAREVGYQLELKDVYIDPIIPNNIIDINNGSVDFFLKNLSSVDHDFLLKSKEAHRLGKVLRYVGNIKQGKCYVQIESVGNSHPLFEVKNGENALAFFTKYYQPLPLLLRGYGAGNNVTASGIFSDLLRILSYK